MPNPFCNLCATILVASVALKSFAAEASGDVKQWKVYQRAGERALKAKDSIEAEKQFTLAMQEAERMPKDKREGRLRESLEALAPLLQSHRKFVEAQNVIERICGLYATKVGLNDIKVAGWLLALGQVCLYGGEIDRAETAYLRSEQIINKNPASSPAYQVAVKSGLAKVRNSQKRFDEAEALYKTAIQIADSPSYRLESQSDGFVQWQILPSYTMLAGLYNNLGVLYLSREKLGDAEMMFQKALSTYRQSLESRNDGVALALANLGEVQLRRGKHAEAEKNLRKALTLREKSFGKGHPIIAETLEGLAKAVERRSPTEAAEFRSRAQAVRAALSNGVTAQPQS